jgi:ABC-type polysaccharide/polyol phosphate export permease
MGILWFFAAPLALPLVIYFFVPISNANPSTKLLIVLSGYAHWYLFASGISILLRGFRPLRRYILGTNISFLSFFSSILLAPIIQTLAIYSLIFFAVGYQKNDLGFQILDFCFLAGALINTLALTLGFGAMLAALNLYTRDIKFGVPYLLSVLVFVFPVFYELESPVDSLFFYMPLVSSIEVTRYVFGVSDWLPQNTFFFIQSFIIYGIVIGVIYCLNINRNLVLTRSSALGLVEDDQE